MAVRGMERRAGKNSRGLGSRGLMSVRLVGGI